jgi:hypothetical protein
MSNTMVKDEITISNDSQAARMLREVLPGGQVTVDKVEKILTDWALNQLKERKRKELDKAMEKPGRPWREVCSDIEAKRGV